TSFGTWAPRSHQSNPRRYVRRLSLWGCCKDGPSGFDDLNERLIHLPVPDLSVPVIETAERERHYAADSRRRGVNNRPHHGSFQSFTARSSSPGTFFRCRVN